MRKICISLPSALIFMSTAANAGVYALTHHSRANCGNNETISWHLGHQYWFWTNSVHRGNHKDHQEVQDWVYTWRAGVVHWGEGISGGWSVEGHHWMRGQENRPVQVAVEAVTNCSIYDGWWDH